MRIIGNDPKTPRQTHVVASGALSTGDTIVVNSDGTVSAVSGAAEGVGGSAVYEASTQDTSITYDANAQKVVVSYNDLGNGYYGTAAVGTVSGTSISFGTPVVFNSAFITQLSSTYDANAQKVVMTYREGGATDYFKIVVGTVSGTSISFGTPVIFSSTDTRYTSATYDSNAQKVVVAYSDWAGGGYGKAIVGTVSGTSISFGSAATFNPAQTEYISSTFDSSSNKVVISYRDAGNSYYGTAVVGTVSGTSISFGTEVVFDSVNTPWTAITYDANAQKVVIAYIDFANSEHGTAVVGTVSGTSISFGTPVVFNAAGIVYPTATYDSNTQKVAIAYGDVGNSTYGTVIVGTVSGTSISFGSEYVYNNGSTFWNSAVFDSSANRVVIAYQDAGSSNNGTASVFTVGSTNLTSENYIGIAKSGAADGDGIVVNTQGNVDTGQTGLTAGQSYYVQSDGTLSTTAGDPSVFAGTAVSSTKLIVKG